ncbi:MAG: MBOAT family protein [Clostridia bacterium]|nr:MBOAT family protein [Clostridia bacterium]
MVFSSLFFLYFFLPLNLIVYRLVPSIKAKNITMLVFSLVFYAWGEPVYVLLLVLMTVADYFLSLCIDKCEPRSKRAKLFLALTLTVNLGMLAVFKYGSFFLSNLKLLTGFPTSVPSVALPIGISFYTFQLISYVADVYRRRVPAQKSFYMLLLYVSMFHQCIAGPIVRYKDVYPQLVERRATFGDISDGVWRFSFGLAKKAILANTCGSVVDNLLNQKTLATAPALSIWVGVFAFSLQVYLDFSAYSDMAIGMGRMIGIHYNENFDYPYISKSVTEFWRRWHISLGSFFRDYVYIPLGGNRKGKPRTFLNLFIVWTLTGLWHGASWNFVLWGLYFFLFICLEKLFFSKIFGKNKYAPHIYLCVVVFFGWILFKFTSVSDVLTVLKGMIGLNSNKFINFESGAVIESNIFILLFSAVASTPIIKKAGELITFTFIDRWWAKTAYAVGKIALPLLLLLLSTAALIGESYNPFLYFKF